MQKDGIMHIEVLTMQVQLCCIFNFPSPQALELYGTKRPTNQYSHCAQDLQIITSIELKNPIATLLLLFILIHKLGQHAFHEICQ